MRRTATYSDDHYLLMRLYTDLKLCGVASCDWWNYVKHPFDEHNNKRWLFITYDKEIEFHNHEGGGDPFRFKITEKNYTKVLTEILKP